MIGCAMTAWGLWAGTIGLWTFDGTPGSTVALGTTFTNKIDESTFPLQSVDRYGTAESTGKLSTFVTPYGEESAAYYKPARVGTETPLGSAYHIAGAGSNSGCPLYLYDENGALNLQTFTLEFIVKFSGTPNAWAMVASRNYHYFGAGLGTYYNGLYVRDGWNWVFHYCCQTNESGAVGYGDINLGAKNLNDGKWHHFALRVNGTEHKVSCYIDYKQLPTVGDLPGPLAYDYTDGDVVERNPWIFGNHQVYSNYSWAGDFAAIRLSDEHVVVKNTLRLGTTLAADEQTLLWLPLDTDFGALACVNEQPTNGTFGAGVETALANDVVAFTNLMANVRPVDGNHKRLRADNKGCLAVKGGYVDLALKPYMLDVPNAVTVEFFLNARESEIVRGSWLAFLACRHDAQYGSGSYYGNRLPFVFQENGAGAMYFRADTLETTSCAVSSTPQIFDGTWHHVAMTIEQMADNQHKLTGYVDYQPVGTSTMGGWTTLEDYHFLRIGQKDKTYSIFLIDELRISKGALGVADFLRLKGLAGTAVLIR
jgi:hypothetical protein